MAAIKEQLGKLTAARAKLAETLKAVAANAALDAGAKVAPVCWAKREKENAHALIVAFAGHSRGGADHCLQERDARCRLRCVRYVCASCAWLMRRAVLYMHGLFEILKRGIALLEKEADQIVGSSVNLSIAIDSESGASSADNNVAIPSEPKDALLRLAALRGFLRAKMRSFRKGVAGLVANLHLVAEPFAGDKALVEAIKTITAITETEMSIDNATGNEILDQNYELVDLVVLVWLVHG